MLNGKIKSYSEEMQNFCFSTMFIFIISDESFKYIALFYITCNLRYVQLCFLLCKVNPLSANPTKWSNLLKQFGCLSILWNWHEKV